MTGSPLRVWQEADGHILRLRLDRPKANIVDAAMIAALDAALAKGAADPAHTAVILDAEGSHFSFGASVEEHLPNRCAAMLAALHGLVRRMLDHPVPILVAVRGQCLGGGLEVAAAGHLMFVAPDAQFGQPEMKLGVFAPAASCLLPERIGQAAAEELLYSGRSIGADEAQRLGLITSLPTTRRRRRPTGSARISPTRAQVHCASPSSRHAVPLPRGSRPVSTRSNVFISTA